MFSSQSWKSRTLALSTYEKEILTICGEEIVTILGGKKVHNQNKPKEPQVFVGSKVLGEISTSVIAIVNGI